jgi:hypothetical protein
MFNIFCNCGSCVIELYDEKPTLSLFCGCEDCRQATEWGAKNGAKPASPFAEAIYMRSDIAFVKGRENMKAVQLRKNAKSTRVYCKDCHSILGIDHPNYCNNVFMFFRNYCETNFKLPDKVAAAIYLDDLPSSATHLIPTDIPLLYSFPRDREKFRSIASVSNSFKKPDHPPKGITFLDLIKSMDKIEVLELEKGEQL